MKYNFHDVKSKCLRDNSQLPEDINAPIERIVRDKIGDAELLADLKYCRENKKFGDYVFDGVFSAEFHFGVIKMAVFQKKMSSRGTFNGSVLNTNVDFSKPKNEVKDGRS
jgi:hypothetical protein